MRLTKKIQKIITCNFNYSSLITLARTSHCPYPQVTCVIVYVAANWEAVNTQRKAENLQILAARQNTDAHFRWTGMLTGEHRPALPHTPRYVAHDCMLGTLNTSVEAMIP